MKSAYVGVLSITELKNARWNIEIHKVNFFNKDNTAGITLMYWTRNADENLRDIYRPGNCDMLSFDVLSRLRDEEGYLKFKVEILRELVPYL